MPIENLHGQPPTSTGNPSPRRATPDVDKAPRRPGSQGAAPRSPTPAPLSVHATHLWEPTNHFEPPETVGGYPKMDLAHKDKATVSYPARSLLSGSNHSPPAPGDIHLER
ncbi:hypothetical protein GCM10009745_22230 [Kribbella yunnanensis]|uniref:Uncharacterized protein n=1 Tax=Kribbella yunnanensis TaxID=190194 RepID=A0ABN2GXN1_9ACTN